MNNKEKKIIFYIDVMKRGGAQRVMSVIVNHLAKTNDNLVLITDFKSENLADEYEINSNVKRLYLRESIKGNAILKNIERIKCLRRIVKSEKPDIILSFLGRPNIRMLLATIGLKCKKFVSVRNDPNKEYGTNFIKKLFSKTLFLLADGCVFQTSDASKYFFKKTQKKSKIIFNPVDEKFYTEYSNTEKKDIISVGRLEPQKNHKLLIEAFENISQEIEENLLIYGDGNLKEELQKFVNDKRLNDRVLFMGNVKDIDVVLQSAKVFVLSSDYEGMPNALMEAMATGVGCISTDCPCGGPKALIENDTQGILVPCGDSIALSNAIQKMLLQYKKYGEAAKQRAKKFKEDKILKEWEDYLFNS